ncbi:hypothetical protein LCGC14_1292410 [marine sediment metagenome]|uniref:Uncharacterized protein n=1 Tax=marine sediment metagenome TaxID=412755 RepID=A0A0F9NUX8_9ZZZZ
MKDKLLKYSVWLWRFNPMLWIILSLIVFCALFGFSTLAVIYTTLCIIALAIIYIPIVYYDISYWYDGLKDWWRERPWKRN